MPAGDIVTHRLRLIPLGQNLLDELLSGARTTERFACPPDWPDETDQHHLHLWRNRCGGDDTIRWGPHAMVDGRGTLVGHAGFHRPPTSMDTALDDPTYDGDRPPSTGGVVELGYTVLAPNRGQGLATEAVIALLESARSSGLVSDVLATVEPTNTASLAVLDRIGGFSVIGTCRDEQGMPELVLHHRLV